MNHLNRRVFLRDALLAAGAMAGTGKISLASGVLKPPYPEPCLPERWKKHGVVLEPTEPWEGRHIQDFTNAIETLDDGRWRIWYSAVDPAMKYSIAYAEGIPGKPMKKFPMQCAPGLPPDGPLTMGNLPEKWKPVQVVHIALQNGRHRIYFWAHGPGIARYLAAESEDGRRYRVLDPLRPVLYHPHDRAAHGVATPDGTMLHKERNKIRPADEPEAPRHLITNDATNIYQLDNGSFELYSATLVSVPKDDPAFMPHDNAPGFVRVIDRLTSGNGLYFEKRHRVIERDAKDPTDQQFYHLAVTCTPRGRVGMLGHYRCQAQTMDLEWCFSKDGAKWYRPCRRAWIARGPENEPDSYGIYPPNRLVFRDDQWHLFYTGVNSAHNGKHSYGKPRTVVMHATTDSIWA